MKKIAIILMVLLMLVGCSKGNQDTKVRAATGTISNEQTDDVMENAVSAVTRGNLQNTGVFRSKKIEKQPKMLWQTNIRTLDDPFINDKILYMVSGANVLIGIDIQNGAIKFQKTFGNYIDYVTISKNQVILIINRELMVSYNNATWAKNWETKLPEDLIRYDRDFIKLYAIEDFVYLAGVNLYAFDVNNGQLKWTRENLFSDSLVYDNGKIFKFHSRTLNVFNSITGNMIWTKEFPIDKMTTYRREFIPNQIMVSNNLVYLNNSEIIIALDQKDGDLKWKYLIDKSVNSCFKDVLVNKDKVYLPCNNILITLNSLNGEKIDIKENKDAWRDLKSNQDFQISLVDGNNLYNFTRLPDNQDISAFDLRNFKSLWKMPIKIGPLSKLLICDGKIFIFNQDSTYAIGGEEI